jgi:hypothetical protein
MVRTAILVFITIVAVYIGLELSSQLFDIPRSEILSWTGFIFVAYLLEKVLKYILLMPFKIYLKEVRSHHLGRNVQEMGFSLSYVSVWLAVGFTPINMFVQGQSPAQFITYPIFLKIALVLIFSTVLFSLLWWLSLRIKK